MKKLTVLGVGSAGCRITGILNTLPGAENLRLLGFDCDAEALKNSGLPEENLILAGVKWRGGKGCGGKVNDGKAAAAVERETLAGVLEGTPLLVVIAGLGRGFGTGSMSVIQSVTSKLKIPTVFLLNTPFLFEGGGRTKLAENTINCDLLPLPLFEKCDLSFAVANATDRLKNIATHVTKAAVWESAAAEVIETLEGLILAGKI